MPSMRRRRRRRCRARFQLSTRSDDENVRTRGEIYSEDMDIVVVKFQIKFTCAPWWNWSKFVPLWPGPEITSRLSKDWTLNCKFWTLSYRWYWRFNAPVLNHWNMLYPLSQIVFLCLFLNQDGLEVFVGDWDENERTLQDFSWDFAESLLPCGFKVASGEVESWHGSLDMNKRDTYKIWELQSWMWWMWWTHRPKMDKSTASRTAPMRPTTTKPAHASSFV